MQRDCNTYLNDILESIFKIHKYVDTLKFDDFSMNSMVFDAVARNLEIIGEAVTKIPADFKEKHQDIEWRKISALRNLLIHEYFGIDKEIVWDVIKHKIPELETEIKKLVSEENK